MLVHPEYNRQLIKQYFGKSSIHIQDIKKDDIKPINKHLFNKLISKMFYYTKKTIR